MTKHNAPISLSKHPVIRTKQWLKSTLLSKDSSRGARAGAAFLLEWLDCALHIGIYWLAYVCVFAHMEPVEVPMFLLIGIAWTLLWLALYGAFACCKAIKAWNDCIPS